MIQNRPVVDGAVSKMKFVVALIGGELVMMMLMRRKEGEMKKNLKRKRTE